MDGVFGAKTTAGCGARSRPSHIESHP